LFVAVLGFPIAYAVYLAFFKTNLDLTRQFVGLGAFAVALRDRYFWNALTNTSVYTVTSVTLHVVIGFGLALLLNRPGLRGRRFFRILFMIPWTISFVVTSEMWRWILNTDSGILNALLREVGLINQDFSWLGSATLAMPAAMAVNVWRGYPFAMVMLYAGLQLIPLDQLEAARVDGVSRAQEFFYVVLPNLRPVLFVVTVLDFIWVFIQFDLIQVLTVGGPGRTTELLSNLIYRQAYEYYDFGMASAIAVLMLLVTLAFSVAYVRLSSAER